MMCFKVVILRGLVGAKPAGRSGTTVVLPRAMKSGARLAAVILGMLTAACGSERPVGAGAAAGAAVGDAGTPPDRDCAVQTLARLAPSARDIEVDGEHVYVARPDGVFRVPKSGGDPALVVASEQGGVFQIQLRGSDLYWVEGSDGPAPRSFHALRRASKLGESPITIASGERISLFELQADQLHFVTVTGVAESRISVLEVSALDGSGRQVIATLGPNAWSFFADADGFYWIEGIGPEAVLRAMPLTGGMPRTIALGVRRVVASDTNNLYAVSAIPVGTSYEQLQVWRLPKDGSAMQPVAVIDDPSDEGDYRLASDGEHLYWSEETGHALRVPVAGGSPPVSLGKGPGFDVDDSFPPLLIAIDATHAYWQVAPPEVVPEEYEPWPHDPMMLVRSCK